MPDDQDPAPHPDKQSNLFDHAPVPKNNVSTRFHTRAMTPPSSALHAAILSKASELEALFDQIPTGRYRSLAYTDLENSILWAERQLTA